MPSSIGFYQILYWNTVCAFAFLENESRFQEAKHMYIWEFYESMGLTEANFLHPLAKLCVQDAGRMPKKSLHPKFCQAWSGSKLFAKVISRHQSALAGKELNNSIMKSTVDLFSSPELCSRWAIVITFCQLSVHLFLLKFHLVPPLVGGTKDCWNGCHLLPIYGKNL